MPDPNPGSVVHLVVGPAEHGVVRHGRLIASACGHPVRWTERPAALDPAELAGVQVVHLSYTDRLFAPDCDSSSAVFESIAAPLTAAGINVSVTLHDLPTADSAWGRRRVAAYRRVVATATGVVVNSLQELRLVTELGGRPRSLRMIPLPIEPASAPPVSTAGSPTNVVVLGFVFPDRGYEHTIDELPAGVAVLALGRPSEGHEDLPGVLAERATAHGSAFVTTGFVPDAELSTALWAAGVPIAPNRRVTASASINTWLAHGRRPLVPDMPYSRDLLRTWPGTLTLYDPDVPGDLTKAIERAMADPGSTWLSAGTAPGPSLPDVAADYRRHLAGCQPAGLISVGDGRSIFPENRWDLLDGMTPAQPPSVSVVIPYFEAQHDLDLVLTGLARQHHPAGRLQVVVADDGSSRPPDLAAADGLDVVLVHQENRGFRAAAARNLGASVAEGTVLLFLDGDTVPEPHYVSRLARLPALAPDALVVGRRRHADLGDWTPDRLADWLIAAESDEIADAPTELTDPGWLLDAYRDTGNLLRADARSYRHVISAVLGLPRVLFDEIGGFCEEFTEYGGEDWELANRAWVAGAGFAHVRDAVGWHIGADWAGRAAGERQSKNAETLALARLLPDPVSRGGGQWLPYPAIVVRLPAADPAGALVTARTAFGSGADCGIWLTGPSGAKIAAMLGDPRINSGEPSAEVLCRAQVLVDLAGPCRLDLLLRLAADAHRLGELCTPAGRFTAGRSLRRARRWAAPGADPGLLQATLFGGHDRPEPAPVTDVDLAHELPRSQPVRRS